MRGTSSAYLAIMVQMDAKYVNLWKLAKPYYEKGRIYDVLHIEWMMAEAEKLLNKEKQLDSEILLPVVILHDTGYSKVGQSNPNVKDPNTKKMHMEEGAKISEKLLTQLEFDEKIVARVSSLISVHDNWVFGDNRIFQEVPEMAAFNDLDFMYPFGSFDQFKRNAESMGLNEKEAFDCWLTDEKFENRPLCCKYTKNLFEKLKENIKSQIY